jgi:ribosomal protein L17
MVRRAKKPDGRTDLRPAFYKSIGKREVSSIKQFGCPAGRIVHTTAQPKQSNRPTTKLSTAAKAAVMEERRKAVFVGMVTNHMRKLRGV